MKKLTELAKFTDNLPEMTSFYQDLIGAEPVAQSEGMSIFMLGEIKLFLHQSYTPTEDELPPENHIAITVNNVDAVCQELTATGIDIQIPAKKYYWGYSAYLRDPDGQLIELIQGDKAEASSPD